MSPEVLIAKEDTSQAYSNEVHWLKLSTAETTSDATTYEYTLPLFSERVLQSVYDDQRIRCESLPSADSAYPSKFQSTYNINAQNFNLICSSFKNLYQVLMYSQGDIQKKEHLMLPKFYTEGPSDDEWTVSWVTDISTECAHPEFGEAKLLEDELSKLANELNQDISIAKDNSLYALADKVVEQMEERRKEDIEIWSEKLAKDLSKLKD